MPPNSEIEKLERRWKENPRGTVFAPYAEVLRKHGDHLLARDVLRQGLELHPDHIPGNIVLGRCCLDLREDGPAEAAFTHVLDLDPENVIALKALAEITERQGRLMEARGWLSRLIAVDPSNDEARDQLERVDSAREAAAAAITSPLTVQGAAEPDAAAETTATVEVVARTFAPQPGTMAEVATGEVSDHGDDVDGAVDAALDAFGASSTRGVTAEEVDTVPILPVVARESAPIADLEPLELDVAAAAGEFTAEQVSGFEPEIPFAPPPPAPPSAASEVFAVGVEEPVPLDLRVGGSTEFQTPDVTDELLNLSAGKSEFQEPDDSLELTSGGTAALEYQTPSGAEELLSAIDRPGSLEPPLVEPSVPEPMPLMSSGPATTGFAAISLMPTEELSTDLPLPPAPQAAGEALPALEEPERHAEAAAVTREPEPARPSDLKLIFPDDAAEPEPPRIRRISQEVRPRPVAEPISQPVATEPQPVVTESMAELYARQGHTAEALAVYRTLLARQPNDSRLAERIRALEQQRGMGSRRLSYVALDTGGESVESFFRALAGARPGGGGSGEEDAEGAPTRPARDPLSLSAIFGEEPAAAAPSGAHEPSAPGAPDPYSFDQFFGGGQGSPATTGPRPAMPSEDDLDQFQHWLKSLKR